MSHTASFFRQSAWMMVAAVAQGALMFAVHFFSKKIPNSEYGILTTMLAVLNVVTTFSIPMQMVFAHQTAAAITDQERRQLSGKVRAVWLGTLGIWVILLLVTVVFQSSILANLKVANPAVLWVTLLVALGYLWFPTFCGVLQGQQNFLWLGWVVILSGLGRLVPVTIIVLFLGGHAAGMLTGAAIGIGLATGIAIWQGRSVWRERSEPFDGRAFLREVVPLALGFSACQFIFTADPIFVQTYFDKDQTGFYNAAGTLARALVMFTAPLVSVMFPKIVRSKARGEKTNLMMLTLVCTAVLVSGAALGLTLVAPYLVRIVYTAEYVPVTGKLLPWFAWTMVPMALASVLINNLLAKSHFRIVPWLIALALGYWVALTQFHDSFMMIIRVLACFNLTLLALSAWFTWREKDAEPLAPDKAARGSAG